MRSRVTEETKQQAYKLRAKGASYKDIAVELAGQGVTLDWCKRELKDIKSAKPYQDAAEQIYVLSLRPHGISKSEFYLTIKTVCLYADDAQIEKKVSDDIRRRVRAIAKAKNTVALFPPEWMDLDRPTESLNTMLSLAHNLNDRIFDCVFEYLEDFPEANFSLVTSELLALAIPGLSLGGIEDRCKRNSVAAEELQRRKPPAIVHAGSKAG